MHSSPSGARYILTALAFRLKLAGMVIQPESDETFEIIYNVQKTESWDMYAQALDTFLERMSEKAYRDGLSHILPRIT